MPGITGNAAAAESAGRQTRPEERDHAAPDGLDRLPESSGNTKKWPLQPEFYLEKGNVTGADRSRARARLPAGGPRQIFAEEVSVSDIVLSTIAQTHESDQTFSAVSIISMIV